MATRPEAKRRLEAVGVADAWSHRAARDRSIRFRPGDIGFLVDFLVLLGIAGVSAVVSGALDAIVGLFALFVFAGLTGFEVTRSRMASSALDDVRHIGKALVLAFAGASAVSTLTSTGSTQALLFVTAATGPVILGGRFLGRAVESLRPFPDARSRVLVVGAGEVAARVISTLEAQPAYGFDVLAAVDSSPLLDAERLGTRVIPRSSDLVDLIAQHDADGLIVAYSAEDQGPLVLELRAVLAAGIPVWVVPRFFELAVAGESSETLGGLRLERLLPPPTRRALWPIKRLVDFVAAAFAVVLLAPVMAFLAVAVYVDSGGPILYRQRRLGPKGRSFEILKFRSMRVRPTSLEDQEWQPDEQSITRIGGFLRRSMLDELPQLFNVLKGEMSLVGPRPERPHFAAEFSQSYKHYSDRHRVPPGITGWAQVNGLKGDTSISDRAYYDNYYIEHWGMVRDFQILTQTLGSMVKKEQSKTR